MTEALTFANFTVGKDSVYDIGAVPEQENTPSRQGIVGEIKTAFGYTDNDLAGLIGHVAPYKTLQDNIEFASETLSRPEVAEELNYAGKSAVQIAREWGERSGLQKKVFRPFMGVGPQSPEVFQAAILTDGVVRWMLRMGAVVEEVGSMTQIQQLTLASAERQIGDGEHEDVEGGTKANHYMGEVLMPRLVKADVFDAVELIASRKKDGNSVMARAAAHLAINEEIDLSTAKVIVPAVAGNWMQKGAQARTALQKVSPDFDTDPENRQLWVACDELSLGETGHEPKATHQNPLSAIGNELRGAKLLSEQG